VSVRAWTTWKQQETGRWNTRYLYCIRHYPHTTSETMRMTSDASLARNAWLWITNDMGRYYLPSSFCHVPLISTLFITHQLRACKMCTWKLIYNLPNTCFLKCLLPAGTRQRGREGQEKKVRGGGKRKWGRGVPSLLIFYNLTTGHRAVTYATTLW